MEFKIGEPVKLKGDTKMLGFVSHVHKGHLFHLNDYEVHVHKGNKEHKIILASQLERFLEPE